MVDFGSRVKVDLKAACHEPGDRLFKFRNPVIRIATVFWLVDFMAHHLPNRIGGHRIVFANSKVEKFPLRACILRFSLGAFNFFKLVDVGAFAVIATADAAGKEMLKIGITHVRIAKAGCPSVLGKTNSLPEKSALRKRSVLIAARVAASVACFHAS